MPFFFFAFFIFPFTFYLHFLDANWKGIVKSTLHTLKRRVSRVCLFLYRKEKTRGDEGEEEEEEEEDTYEERLTTTPKRRSSTRRRTKEEFLENDETKERKRKWVPTF